MMETSVNVLHYQTSFVVTSETVTAIDLELKRKVWRWIQKKETRDYRGTWMKDPRFRYFWNWPLSVGHSETGRDFFERGRLKPVHVGIKKSPLQSTLCWQDAQTLWGMRYQEETDENIILTEVGIVSREEGRSVVFNIRVLYHPKNIWYDFKPSVPRIVRDIVRDERFVVSGGDGVFNFSEKPMELFSEKDGANFEKYLFSPNRMRMLALAIPVPNDVSQAKERVEMFANQLVGKTSVFFVDPSSKVYPFVAQVLKERATFRATMGTLWLIPPCKSFGKLSGTSYPLANLSKESLPVEGVKRPLLPSLLAYLHRRHLVIEDGAILFADVQRALENSIAQKERDFEALQEAERQAQRDLERKQQIAESERATAQSKAEAEEAKRLFEQKEKERQKLEEVLKETRKARDDAKEMERAFLDSFDKIENENKELSRALEEVIREKEVLRAQLQQISEKNAEVLLEEKLTLLESFNNVKNERNAKVAAIKGLFEDRLVLTEKALKFLEGTPQQFTFSDAVKFLRVLYVIVYPTYKADVGMRRDTYVRNSGCGLEYSANENPLTMKQADLRELRTVHYKGSSYECQEHLKMSEWRAYFTYSRSEGKIIICSIGKHLDTAGTKRKGL